LLTSCATGILDDETFDWLGVARALLLIRGEPVIVAEEHVQAAQVHAVAAGFDADETGTAGYAGVLAAMRSRLIDPVSSVAVRMTGVRGRKT